MNGMIEVARNSVQSWEIDQMGHMNVQFYLERASDGLAALAVRLGLGPRAARDLGARLCVREFHVRFLRERRPGAPFLVRAGVLEADPQGLRVYLEMVATVSGTVAAAFTVDVDLRDDQTGERRALGDETLARARALSTQRPEYGAVRGVSRGPARAAMTLKEAESMGLLTTYQACIRPADCDAHGRLSARQFMAIVSNAVPNLLAQSRLRGGEGAGAAEAGGAALEYRYVLRGMPRAGDVVTLRSALTAIGAKTYSWCHWLFDLETGAALASAEAIGVAMDLEARKAIAIPDAMRARLETLVVEELRV